MSHNRPLWKSIVFVVGSVVAVCVAGLLAAVIYFVFFIPDTPVGWHGGGLVGGDWRTRQVPGHQTPP
jgi:hypothetical protein